MGETPTRRRIEVYTDPYVYPGDDWDLEASYLYYQHGPLARIEIGDKQVQGIDYAYTLHGWLKGMNADQLKANVDMGQDGKSGSPHENFGQDVVGFSLSYFDNDYSPIGGDEFEASYSTSAGFGGSSASLYNGNIRRATYALEKLDDETVGHSYTYDQLNRLVGVQTWDNYNPSTNTWPGSGTAVDKWEMAATYDANGNIMTLNRNGSSPIGMDSLTYSYYGGTNQLKRVDDAVGTTNYDEDVDDQSGNNYAYDAMGNLVQDVAEGIDTILWTLSGKVDSISRGGGSTADELKFMYDAFGNRVGKTVTKNNGNTITYWYVRDAQGNIMSVYTQVEDTITWREAHIYGSSRLGYMKRDSSLFGVEVPTDYEETAKIFLKQIGLRRYELTNHLGNVLGVITDKKIYTPSAGPKPELVQVQDYYPFGMMMSGRYWSSESCYRFGYNTQEKVDEIAGSGNHYTAKYWEYDPRIVRRWNTDPVTYPWQSSYAVNNNNPIIFLDPLGLFGTRKEARQYRKDNNTGGRIRKNSDGVFSIDNKKAGTSIWNDSEFGISKGVLVEAERVPGKVSNLPSDISFIYDPLASVERGKQLSEYVPAIILHRTVSTNGQSQFNRWKESSKVAGTHFLVGEDGTVYQTGNLQKYTIHLYESSKQMYPEYFGKFQNSNTIGIEVIGGYNEKTKTWDALTPAQVKATAELVLELTYRYNLEIHDLFPHEKVQRKTKGEGQVVLDAIKQQVEDGW